MFNFILFVINFTVIKCLMYYNLKFVLYDILSSAIPFSNIFFYNGLNTINIELITIL